MTAGLNSFRPGNIVRGENLCVVFTHAFSPLGTRFRAILKGEVPEAGTPPFTSCGCLKLDYQKNTVPRATWLERTLALPWVTFWAQMYSRVNWVNLLRFQLT